MWDMLFVCLEQLMCLSEIRCILYDDLRTKLFVLAEFFPDFLGIGFCYFSRVDFIELVELIFRHIIKTFSFVTFFFNTFFFHWLLCWLLCWLL